MPTGSFFMNLLLKISFLGVIHLWCLTFRGSGSWYKTVWHLIEFLVWKLFGRRKKIIYYNERHFWTTPKLIWHFDHITNFSLQYDTFFAAFSISLQHSEFNEKKIKLNFPFLRKGSQREIWCLCMKASSFNIDVCRSRVCIMNNW